jgi:hypothetical protein
MYSRFRAPLTIASVIVAGAALAGFAARRPLHDAEHAVQAQQSQQITVYRTPG